MIYSLAGTQGSGKTTILHSLKKLGYDVIDRKTSRSILSDWGVTLPDVYKDTELMASFQDELILRKYNDEKDFYTTQDIVFTDRSFIDLLVYSSIILGHNNTYAKWLDAYYNKCKKFQKSYVKIFYIKPLPFITKDDGVRGSSSVYNILIDDSIGAHLSRINRVNTIEINEIDHDDRIKKIIKNL